MEWGDWKELIGDALIVGFGIILLFIFVTIEMYHSFGQEPNKYIRWIELFLGGVIVLAGIERMVDDLKHLGK